MTENKKQTKRGPYSTEDKLCIDCFKELTLENTRAADIAQANYTCRACRKLRDQARYIARKEIIREQQREYNLAKKMRIIEAYGGKCVCCGESILEFLTIDHIHNDGAQERKETKRDSGEKLYRWLIQNNFPKDNYQLLCYNCNCAKAFFGYCPHNKPDVIIGPTIKSEECAG